MSSASQDLAALATVRAQLVEQLQAVDDQAAEIVQALQADAQAAAGAWPHVVPKPLVYRSGAPVSGPGSPNQPPPVTRVNRI